MLAGVDGCCCQKHLEDSRLEVEDDMAYWHLKQLRCWVRTFFMPTLAPVNLTLKVPSWIHLGSRICQLGLSPTAPSALQSWLNQSRQPLVISCFLGTHAFLIVCWHGIIPAQTICSKDVCPILCLLSATLFVSMTCIFNYSYVPAEVNHHLLVLSWVSIFLKSWCVS